MFRALIRRLDSLSGPGLLAALAIAVAPLAMGGVHTVTRVVVAGLALTAFLWTAERVRADRGRLELGLPGAALFVIVAWSVLQWLPLPFGLVSLIAPTSAAAAEATALALGSPAPSWVSLSLDPPRTAGATLTLASLLSIYLVVLNATRGSIPGRLLRWTTTVAAIVLCIGIAQTALGFERIYGLYEASIDLDDVQLIKTTFVNPNHAAALFLLTACVSFGLWLDSSPVDRRRNWYLGVTLLLCLGVVGSLSRANTVLLAAALLAIVGLVQLRHAGRTAPRRAVRVVASLVCLAAIAVLLVDPHRWWAELRTILDPAKLLEQEGPVACWRVGWQVVDAQPWVGAGHGAFASMASARMVDWDLGFADYAHNAVIQAVADWGWPVAVLAGGLLIGGLAGFIRLGVRQLDLLGVAVGLVAVMIQNMVDFSLLMPGVAIPAAAAAGYLAAGTVRSPDEPKDKGARSIRVPWSLVGTLSVLVCGLALGYDALAHDAAQRESEVRSALAAKSNAPIDIRADLARHPADFTLFRIAAIAAHREGRVEEGLRYADRAVALAGREPETIRVRALLRLASEDVPGGADDLARLANLGGVHVSEASDLVWGHSQLEGLVEATFSAHPSFALAAGRRLHVQNHVAAAERLFAWASQTFPEELVFREELAMLLSRRPEEAPKLAALATRTLAEGGTLEDPEQARLHRRAGYMLEGFHLKSLGRHNDAYHMFLEAALLDTERSLRPLLEAGEALMALEEPRRLSRILPDLEVAARAGGPSWMAAYHRLVSHDAEARGDLRTALRAARSAVHYLPGNPRHHYRLATLLERHGDPHAAARARQRAELLGRDNAPDLIDWMNPHLALDEEPGAGD